MKPITKPKKKKLNREDLLQAIVDAACRWSDAFTDREMLFDSIDGRELSETEQIAYNAATNHIKELEFQLGSRVCDLRNFEDYGELL